MSIAGGSSTGVVLAKGFGRFVKLTLQHVKLRKLLQDPGYAKLYMQAIPHISRVRLKSAMPIDLRI